MRGSTTFATPIFGCDRPVAYLSTATPAPVRMLNRLVLPTLGNPRRPNFIPEHLAPEARHCTTSGGSPAARLAHGGGGRAGRPLLDPARVAQDAPQQELDLAVEAAQIVARPALQRGQNLGVDAQQERAALSHGPIGTGFRC